MKILLTTLLLTLTLFGANVDEYAKKMGFERDFKTALAKAKKMDKPLMMVLGADYCPWCRKFERKTLSSELLRPRLEKDVVTLVVDSKYDIKTFPKEFKTSITPRVFMIDPKSGKSFYETTGYVKKRAFLEDLEKMQRLYKAER